MHTHTIRPCPVQSWRQCANKQQALQFETIIERVSVLFIAINATQVQIMYNFRGVSVGDAYSLRNKIVTYIII